MKQNNINTLFSALSDTIKIFINEVNKKNSTLMATDMWTVKEVLCHIVFWHENYAANYKALAENRKPQLLVGPGYKLNPIGVASLKGYSTQELIKRLFKAQDSLYSSIVDEEVPQMTYKKDGRVYKTTEFLHLIERHIHTHTIHIKRAK